MPERFSLDGIRRVMRELSRVNETLPVISIAGTNGKGSAASFISSILGCAGFITGTFTSPHLFGYEERIKVNGEPVGYRDFRRLIRRVRAARSRAGVSLTRFETLTAAAILFFSEKECDYSVMEAGLGGRLDATNVCENKVLSLITSISLEHTGYLGDTVEKIAFEKAGIMRKGSPVVDSSGVPLIRRLAGDRGCPVYTAEKEYFIRNLRPEGEGRFTYDLAAGDKSVKGISPGLRGAHQTVNSAQAGAAALILGVKPSYIKQGIAEAVNPGRLEVFSMKGDRKLVVDAAHNPAGILALKKYLDTRPSGTEVYLIISVYMDKNYSEIAALLDPLVSAAWAFAPDRERSVPAGELAGFFRMGREAGSFPEAFFEAEKLMGPGSWLLVCGSFSAAAPALKYAYEKL